MIIDAGIGDKMDAKSVDIYGIDRSRQPGSRARRGRASRRTTSTSCSRRTCTSIMPAASRRATAPARWCRAFRGARYVVRTARVGGCDPSARAEPRQLPAGKLRAAGGRPACSTWSPGDGRSCRACGSCAPAATRCITRSSMIESGGRTAVFAADLIPTTAHVDEPWIMGYDLYPMDTLAFKRAFVREAIEREYLIFFEHDPDDRGRLHPREGRPEARRARLRSEVSCTFDGVHARVNRSITIQQSHHDSASASSAAAVCTTWRS